MCAAPGSGGVFGALWKEYDKIAETLDDINEYAADEEPRFVAYMDGKGLEEYGHRMMWYIVGRFMKPDAPVFGTWS